MPHAISDLLTRMRIVQPASPRLVWHGQDGRIELSGRVFDNWVAKTSNLLVDELDAVPGTVVELDLPPHWKSLAIAFACWQVGCTIAVPGSITPGGTTPGDPISEHRADILITHRDVQALAPPQLLVCVALGSLAFRWGGELPRAAVDYAAEVRSQGDLFLGDTAGPGTADDAQRPLVTSDGMALTAEDLERLLTAPSPVTFDSDGPTGPDHGANAPGTLLLEPGSPLLPALAAALTAWRQDDTNALVLVEQGVEVTARMLSGERVTARLAPA